MDHIRRLALKNWLKRCFKGKDIEFNPLCGDAGLRNYFRFEYNNQSFIAVDAPNNVSNNVGFIAIQQALTHQGIHVPDIVASDLTEGFFCLSDFGDVLFGDELTTTSLFDNYCQAIDMLPLIANTTIPSSYELPVYDKAFIELELSIFSEWLVGKHLTIALTDNESNQLNQCFSLLVESALEQPTVFMHRDFHSRNIMRITNNQLGVIDFQDAVNGPITYDIVSLLRDCYLRLPDEQITQLFKYFYQQMSQQYNLSDSEYSTWLKWFDFMGIQRHLKASGIFSRLLYRDNKSNYLKDIPQTLEYIVQVSKKYPELDFLYCFIKQTVLPKFTEKQIDMDKMQ